MTSLALKAAAAVLGALILAVVAMWIIGLGPFKSPTKAILKEQGKDAAAAKQVEAKGARATTKAVAAAAVTQDKAKAQVEYVTRTVRLSPTAQTPVPADRLDRLRNADRELCKLGVSCGREGSRP